MIFGILNKELSKDDGDGYENFTEKVKSQGDGTECDNVWGCASPHRRRCLSSLKVAGQASDLTGSAKHLVLAYSTQRHFFRYTFRRMLWPHMITTKLLWLKNHIFKSKNYFSQTSFFNSDIRKTTIWIWIFIPVSLWILLQIWSLRALFNRIRRWNYNNRHSVCRKERAKYFLLGNHRSPMLAI